MTKTKHNKGNKMKKIEPLKIKLSDTRSVQQISINGFTDLNNLLSILKHHLKVIGKSIKKYDSSEEKSRAKYWFNDARNAFHIVDEMLTNPTKIKMLKEKDSETTLISPYGVDSEGKLEILNLWKKLKFNVDLIVGILHFEFKIPYSKIIECDFDIDHYEILEFRYPSWS